MGTKETQEGRGGCEPEGTSDNRGEGGSEVPLFVLAANWRKSRQKMFRPRDSAWQKKRRKVRIEMQGGMTRLWEGHLLQVTSCNETNRKALFFSCEA